ncbi:protein NOI4 [Cucumis sativus]|uniref:RIN4 pathogenic type III effector avirulence factor Avr cleavage site domain-containing protein n=1 Tax=Cucumis sativus TaxID=3659 RepID=A0A0A0LRE5_CUCSA|nr:protein NOI4 [Cucumis sativus]
MSDVQPSLTISTVALVTNYCVLLLTNLSFSILYCSHSLFSLSVFGLLLSDPRPFRPAIMASQDKGRALPKFGDWDVNNPASAEGFTVIFNKARNEKKTTGTAANMVPQERNEPVFNNESYPQYPPPKKRWFCCG